MNKSIELGAVVFSLLLWSCGGDSSPTASTPTPTPVATSITLSATSVSLTSLGATSQLSATVKDQNGATMTSPTVTWATSDAAIATVSDAGLVTSVAYGTATITATSGSLSATASVTSELPATQTMTVLPFDPAAVTLISPFMPSHTGINVYTITGGHFLSPGTGIVTNIELNTGNGLPGGSNYGIRIHLTSTGLYAWYHFEVNGSISDQTQRDNILVALGDQVTAGQHIGNLVSLGTHAHVHFDMLDAGGRDAVQCPLVYFSPAVAEAWESLYDEKIRERDERRIKEGRGPVPALPDVCNEVDLPSG